MSAWVLVLLGCSENTLGVSNAVPRVVITSHLDGDPVTEAIPFLVRAVGSDADSVTETLVATWYTAGVLEPACTRIPLDEDGHTECSVQLLTGTEPWRVQVEVRDERGSVGTASVDLEVIPQQEGISAPTVSWVTPEEGGTSHAGDPIAFEAHVSDAEDDPSAVGLSFVSDRDGEFSVQGADSSGKAQFVYPDLSPGLHVLTVKATDTDGNFTTDLLTYHINGVPTAPVVSITPEEPSSTADLQANLDAPGTDPEGLAVSHTYEWYRDGVLQPMTSSLVFGADTTRGETWTVRVFPHDSDGGTGPYGEASVTVRNAPPVVTSATLSPDPAYTSEVISAAVLSEDADGDPVTLSYDWQVSGVSVGLAGTQLDGAVSFDRGDTVQVFVTANDGSEDGPTVPSNTITIANSPPTVALVSLAPSVPIEQQDDLFCTASGSTDADGDAVSYAFSWTVDGASYPDVGDMGPFTATWPDDSAPGLDTLDGEEWTCLVTPTDVAGLAGPSASASVTIGHVVFVPDYNGTFDIDPDISYRCAGGLVDLDIGQLTFSVSGVTLSVSGGPVVLTAPAPTDENFTAQGAIPGGCRETYTVSGTFQDEDHFIGTYTLSFTGAQCGLTNCTNQAWPVDGYRL